MKTFFLAAILMFSFSTFAQFSEQEADSTSRYGDTIKEKDGRYELLGRQFDMTFFSLASTETDNTNDRGGRISTYNYFTFSSYVGLDYKAIVRIPFTFGTAGTDRFNGGKPNKSEWLFQDVILGFRNPELFYLPWDMAVFWEGRLYLPTSKHSQNSGLIGRVSNKMIFSKVFNRHFEIDLTEEQNYYHQSRTVYPLTFVDEYGFTAQDVPVATKRFEFSHHFSVWGKFNPETGLGYRIGIEDSFFNKSEAENKYRTPDRVMTMGPQMRFAVSDKMNFIFGYADKVDRQKNQAEFGRFLAKNTEFTLLSFVRF